jgi:hypothetical protein
MNEQHRLLGNRFLTSANQLAGKLCFLRDSRLWLRTQQWIQQEVNGVFSPVRA